MDTNENTDENVIRPKKKRSLTPAFAILILLAVFAVIIVSTSFFVVDETEQAVITRLGKYYSTVGAGLHFKLPFGIDKSYNVPGQKAVQTEQFGFRTVKAGTQNQYNNGITSESTMLTGDLNIVDVEWIIQYYIVDPAAWLFNVKERTQTIRDISQSVVNTLVGDRAILAVMSAERTNIEEAALVTMNQNFDALGLGIRVESVKLQNIVPPTGVQDAFEDVNKASQDMERYINEGKEAYNREIPLAQGQADQQIKVAEGYAVERVNKAKGDVARFVSVYEEYKKAPAITRERLYLETMEELFKSKTNQTLIDSELENVLPVKTLTGNGGN
ncbi:MAG: FtsH protease activity modulator HflK [Treponema sp.]|nr:FtsH protease activity modulator HflK [Candidatus Treponema caballi]